MLKVFKNKIIIFFLFSILIASFLFLTLTFNIFKREVIANTKKELSDITDYIEILLKEKLDIEKIHKTIKKSFNLRITLIDKEGIVFFDSEVKKENLKYLENHRLRPEVIAAVGAKDSFSIRKSPTLKLDMMYYAKIINFNGRDIILRTAIDFKEIEKRINKVRNKIIIYFLVIIVIIITTGIYLISKITYPFEKIIYASKEFAKGNFSYRIFIDFKGELKKLAQTLNSMAKNIENMLGNLHSKNIYLKMLLDNINAAICMIDETNKVISINKRFLDIFKISETEYKDFHTFCSESTIIKNIYKAREFKTLINTEIKLDLDNRFYYLTIIPVEKNIIIILYDINEIKQIELIKKELFANISHEFKTPITVIKSNIETILSNDMDKKTLKEFLLAIDKHATRLTELTKDIIELNFIESGKINLEIKEIILKEFIDKIATYFKQFINMRNIKFINDVNKDIKIFADEWVMEKVFANLFDNAIKFNKENGYIKCYTIKNEKLKIIFENSGQKIKEEDIERIFERFYKSDKSRTTASKGSGLGLAIVKHSLNLHNSHIKAENFEEGVRFIITLNG
ncbi:MAG: HAMP domain-containing protein [Elusimicrobiota bacterium]